VSVQPSEVRYAQSGQMFDAYLVPQSEHKTVDFFSKVGF
jgi:hypothetical protein